MPTILVNGIPLCISFPDPRDRQSVSPKDPAGSHFRDIDHRLYDISFRLYHETTGGREITDWDLTSVGLVLIGSSITIAGIIIAALLIGMSVPLAPFLLLTTTILIVMSAALIIYTTPRSPPSI